jgi:SAM-dependent methyltransferase
VRIRLLKLADKQVVGALASAASGPMPGRLPAPLCAVTQFALAASLSAKQQVESIVDSAKAWGNYYRSLTDSYLLPNEFVVRAFLGTYPNLSMSRDYRGKSVCDVSCGDGRNLVLLHKLGLSLSATELTPEICSITRQRLLDHKEQIAVDIRPGSNRALPFADGQFDYLLSWNACYYMENEQSAITDHVAECARILKPGGYLVCSVPAPDCFTLEGADELGSDLVRIQTRSRWNMLNGMIYYRFRSFEHIIEIFGDRFSDFQTARIYDDCFGIRLSYFVFVCRVQ